VWASSSSSAGGSNGPSRAEAAAASLDDQHKPVNGFNAAEVKASLSRETAPQVYRPAEAAGAGRGGGAWGSKRAYMLQLTVDGCEMDLTGYSDLHGEQPAVLRATREAGRCYGERWLMSRRRPRVLQTMIPIAAYLSVPCYPQRSTDALARDNAVANSRERIGLSCRCESACAKLPHAEGLSNLRIISFSLASAYLFASGHAPSFRTGHGYCVG